MARAHHAFTFFKAFGSWSTIRGQLRVVEMKFEFSSGAHFHWAGGKPFSAFLRIREVTPDAFNWTREQSFQANGTVFQSYAEFVVCLLHLCIHHRDIPFFRFLRVDDSASSAAFSKASSASSRAFHSAR